MRLRSQARSHSRGCQCRLGSLPRCAHGRSEDPILEKQLAHPHRRRPRPANLCVPLVLRHRKWSQSSQSSCVHALFDCRTVPVQYSTVLYRYRPFRSTGAGSSCFSRSTRARRGSSTESPNVYPHPLYMYASVRCYGAGICWVPAPSTAPCRIGGPLSPVAPSG